MVQCCRIHRDNTVPNEAPRSEDVCGSGGIPAHIPNLDTRWNRMVTFMPWSLYPRTKGAQYPLGSKFLPLRPGYGPRPVGVGFVAD